ncbi:MAG: hypothetical protein AUK48_00460 [Oscillatoriales cyanobacterium CG2_30_44_21]|nr:MAG: hypothetical protein AUK48_00460 [Oscillatoriales cyanobacterium CG2_30_44_21]
MAQTETQTQSQSQPESPTSQSQLEGTVEQLWQIAQSQGNSPERLLYVLRVLEATHKRIRDDLFQPALPNSRHELFNLLRDIETNGGWPHIYRMKIEEICKYLAEPDDEDLLN